MSDHKNMAVAIINQIISMQSVEEQRYVLDDLFERYGLRERINEPELLTDHVVAEKYGVHIITVQDWLKSGQLKGFKEARKWYTRTDWLREFEDVKASSPRILKKAR